MDHNIDSENLGSVFVSITLFVLTYVSSHLGIFLHTVTALITVCYTAQRWYDYNKAKKYIKKKENEKRD